MSELKGKKSKREQTLENLKWWRVELVEEDWGQSTGAALEKVFYSSFVLLYNFTQILKLIILKHIVIWSEKYKCIYYSHKESVFWGLFFSVSYPMWVSPKRKQVIWKPFIGINNKILPAVSISVPGDWVLTPVLLQVRVSQAEIGRGMLIQWLVSILSYFLGLEFLWIIPGRWGWISLMVVYPKLSWIMKNQE